MQSTARHDAKSFLLLFVGCMMLGSMLLLPHDAYAATRTETKSLTAFPPNATWTWKGQFIQAWLGPLENDAQSGDHVNLHIQPLGGGDKDQEYANYHITYQGITKDAEGDEVYQWSIYDSVTGDTKVISESTSLGPQDAASYATSEMATFIQEDAVKIDAVDLEDLVSTIENGVATAEDSPIVQAFYALIEPAA
jgi:hypothetical protein